MDSFLMEIEDRMLMLDSTRVIGPTNKKWYIDGNARGHLIGSNATRTFDVASENALGPGESMVFSFYSKGLPSIKIFNAESFAPPYSEDDEDSLFAKGYTQEQIHLDLDVDSYITFVVSPCVYYNKVDSLSFLDTLSSFTTRSLNLGWINTQQVAEKYLNYLNKAKTSLQQNNFTAVRWALGNVLHDVDLDSSSTLTSEAYALLRYNTEYLLEHLPLPPTGYSVKLINSTGAKLIGGALQYYEGSWKDAVNNNDGTFSVTTNAKSLSLRMTYKYGSQTKSNVAITSDTIVFQTVNAQIKLQDSQGNTIDTGVVQYYSGAWRTLGTTINGTVTEELLPNNYSFRMTYAYASKDKQQDVGTNPIVVFQTVNATVQLKSSLGNLVDQGTVQYYSGAWWTFGATSGGIATKELLPNNYTFRMTNEYVSNDKAQDLSANPVVDFSTVLCTIRVKNLQNQPVEGAAASYYSGTWRTIGNTVNGEITKELLPANLTFRVKSGPKQQDKTQNLSTNNVVEFVIQP